MSYIDLHCHTIATKSGDGSGRNVDKNTFISKLAKNNVSIVGITNHNYFDRAQYLEFKSNDKGIKVWPGIELDVHQLNGSDAHCILISGDSENSFNNFYDFIKTNKLNYKENAENFYINVKDLPAKVKGLDCIVIIHYDNKTPSFDEEDYDFLRDNLKNNYLLVEPSKLKSAFIYSLNGYSSLVGSDVKDWKNYPGKELPELKIDINGFKEFKELLVRDGNVINNKLREKKLFDLIINSQEFKDLSLHISLYKDINIIIGNRGSGKSTLLKLIFSEIQKDVSNSEVSMCDSSDVENNFKKLEEPNLDFAEPVKSKYEETFAKCINEIKNDDIKISNSIYDFFNSNIRNKLINDIEIVNSSNNFPDLFFDKSKTEIISDIEIITRFQSDEPYKKYLKEEETNELAKLLQSAKAKAKQLLLNKYKDGKANELANKTICNFRDIYEEKKGIKLEPNKIGLFDYFEDLFHLKGCLSTVDEILSKPIESVKKDLGFIEGKGEITKITELSLDPNKTDSKFKPVNNINKQKLSESIRRNFKKYINTANKELLKQGTNKSLINLKELLSENEINTLDQFLYFHTHFLNEKGDDYIPSTGEKSILLLNDILNNSSADFFLLDEPEMGVGHSFVTEHIIPTIIEKAKSGKTFVISTHDPNIAVNTLPYQIIYREIDKKIGGYKTYLGNCFTNLFTNINNKEDKKPWNDIMVDILEGGRRSLDGREIKYGDKD